MMILIMNCRCTVNPQLIIRYDFKHIFTYRMLYQYKINDKVFVNFVNGLTK